MFENDVKIYGIQTAPTCGDSGGRFENDVKIYGIQTALCDRKMDCMFENDVKRYMVFKQQQQGYRL